MLESILPRPYRAASVAPVSRCAEPDEVHQPSKGEVTMSAQIQTLTIEGGSVSWPRVCACCLAPAVQQVAASKTKTVFLVVASSRKTMSVSVPYCATCAGRVAFHHQMTPWVQAFLVFALLGFVGMTLGVFAFVALLTAAPSLTGLTSLLMLLFTLGTPILGTILFVRKKRRDRPQPLPLPHVCGTGPAVRVLNFSGQSLTLGFASPRYAELMRAANPLAAAGVEPVGPSTDALYT